MHTLKNSFLHLFSVLLLVFTTACARHPVVSEFPESHGASFSGPSAIVGHAGIAASGEQKELPEDKNDEGKDEPLKDEPLEVVESESSVKEELDRLETVGAWDEQPQAASETEKPLSDFPITMNRKVQFYLDFFTNDNRVRFRKWLERSTRYLPMIREELQKEGLPQDLCYLALIESGFNNIAYSSARAVGMWQFMRATGRHYGLMVNNYVDERRNPDKATRAAVAYLKDLYAEFGSWYLAVAAYNAGEGKVRQAIRRGKTKDFWQLATQRTLKLETKRYVPKLIAAILIAKEPEKYGFLNLDYHDPVPVEVIQVPRWTTLETVAFAGGMEPDQLRDCNRELRRLIIPPYEATYPLRVPSGKGATVSANLSRVHATVKTEYRTHQVTAKDSLGGICRRYQITKTMLLKANSLSKARLSPGQRLRIPYQKTEYVLLSPEEAKRLGGRTVAGNERYVIHEIQSGETISAISNLYGLSPNLIARWNNLHNIHRIRAGAKLVLYMRPGTEPAVTSADAQQPVPTLHARTSKHQSVSGPYHRVRPGESLWIISRRYHVSMDELRSLNNLENDLIHPGSRLLVQASIGAES